MNYKEEEPSVEEIGELMRTHHILTKMEKNMADKNRQELTNKEIRYALIKGWVERKYPERRPDYCKPDTTLVKWYNEVYKKA